MSIYEFCKTRVLILVFYRRERFLDDFLLVEAVVRFLLLDFANFVLRDFTLAGP